MLKQYERVRISYDRRITEQKEEEERASLKKIGKLLLRYLSRRRGEMLHQHAKIVQNHERTLQYCFDLPPVPDKSILDSLMLFFQMVSYNFIGQ